MLTKKNTREKLLLAFLTLIATVAKAQEFGGNPPSIKWRQVNTRAAKVIFPAGMDSIGSRVANIVNQMNPLVQPTIGYKQKQISILLQNQTTVSNAYVGLAPFRSEFYLTPDQNSFEIGTLPWADQLAIHEYRHVQQFNNFNVGLSKALKFVFGESGQAFGNDLAIPNWFYEGDAVFNETHVSGRGRGRLPYFFNGYRALWDAGKNYSWMKLRNGSFVDFIPDWYPMGYMQVAYGREKYGEDFWKNVTHDAAAYRSLFFPMQSAIKRYSGQSFKQFTQAGFDHFKLIYSKDEHAADTSPYKSEEYPFFVDDNTLIYVKSTYKVPAQFTIRCNGIDKKIITRAISIDSYFDYAAGKIVYAANRPDLRWGYRDYNELRLLDINTGKETTITRRTKYFSPSLSDDGKRVVAVEVDPGGANQLQILDTEGNLITTVPNRENLFYTYPKFFNNSQLIAPVRDTQGKMSLALVDIATGRLKYLLPFSFQPVAFPRVHGDMVYFSATSGINDRLFAVNIVTGKLYTTKQSGLNKYQATVTDNKIAWVEFTATGYKIRQADDTAVKWTELPDNHIPGGLSAFNVSNLSRDSAANLLPAIASNPLPVTRYNKGYHFFNFHSLVPDFSDPNYTVTLEGENILNTFQSEILFNYNRNEGYKEFGFDGAYGALFPWIIAGFNYTLDRRAFYHNTNIYWNESDIHGGVQVPLNFSSGRNITGLTLASTLHFTSTSFQQQLQKIFDQSYSYLSNTVIFSNHIQQARQNIYPRFGESITFNYKRSISSLTANQTLINGTLFLPGLATNHNLLINLAHQQSGSDNVISFSNDFPFSRGYTAENLHQLDKFGADYHFPIAYPDAGIANTLYFMRIRGDLFFDATRARYFISRTTTASADFKSVGGTLYFDTKWFNQQSLTFGVRYSHLLNADMFGNAGPNVLEIVLPVSFL
ncbi:TolB family protein [Mucilaginibacter ximonensis]|uniref:TolB family protein n=1 Tax=Mucilaginibacter ximonensis TaxID=538021 RepID=A0ABW5Y7Y9_9SPHI